MPSCRTAERYLDPLVEGAQLFGLPLARVPEFASALARWTDRLFPGEAAAGRAAAGGRLCALRHRLARPSRRAGRGELPPPAAVPVHRHRPCRARLRRQRHTCPLRRPARRPAGCSRRSGSCRPAAPAGEILGRVILLGYRFSGGVPEILADAHLQISADIVRLEVGTAGRVPDSEVVGDRLGCWPRDRRPATESFNGRETVAPAVARGRLRQMRGRSYLGRARRGGARPARADRRRVEDEYGSAPADRDRDRGQEPAGAWRR